MRNAPRFAGAGLLRRNGCSTNRHDRYEIATVSAKQLHLVERIQHQAGFRPRKGVACMPRSLSASACARKPEDPVCDIASSGFVRSDIPIATGRALFTCAVENQPVLEIRSTNGAVRADGRDLISVVAIWFEQPSRRVSRRRQTAARFAWRARDDRPAGRQRGRNHLEPDAAGCDHDAMMLDVTTVTTCGDLSRGRLLPL